MYRKIRSRRRFGEQTGKTQGVAAKEGARAAVCGPEPRLEFVLDSPDCLGADGSFDDYDPILSQQGERGGKFFIGPDPWNTRWRRFLVNRCVRRHSSAPHAAARW
jgi:hypothetical protein